MTVTLQSRIDGEVFYQYTYGMPRPKKPKGQAREKLMQVRVQPKEYDSFKEAADSSGLDLSAWVRQQLLLAARRDIRKYG
jgi:predicted HicB family RNase H-like nuclease